ncbi:SH3 domain-containing protein [Butyrivibrio sp. VCB2006]|uniref:SH3 domain-containing protein n=1 Tax=Butyrivibrio sp. VCB2006 TaxID=1280679 RepID=UPI000407EF85|nr:SH3 domain-containing protein [Butyrivibrio sp. VCB2006]
MNKLGKKIAGIVLAVGVALTVFAGTSVSTYAYTQTTGKVTSDNVKVRDSASTTAKQVSSLKNGDTIDIVDEATDASGYVWYKIRVNKSEYGYVRSDLVSKAGGSSSTSTTTTSTSDTASLPETSVTATEQKTATITSESVNVRKGAGTSYDSVGKVAKGDTVTIVGEATGTDNKTWYKITFGDGKEGFVRNDLLEVSEAAPVENTEGAEGGEAVEGGENPEGEVAEGGEEPQQPVVDQNQGDGKYSLMYITGEDGNSTWYLYDNEGGYRVIVDELISAAQSAEAVNKLRKQASNFKKIAIILGVLAAILVGAVVVLVLKLRDSLYYEDEEEEEEYDRYDNRRRPETSSARRPLRNDDEEDRPVRRPSEDRPSRRPQERDDERVVRRDSRNADEDRPSRRPAEDRTVRPTRRPAEDDLEAPRPSRRADREASEDVERPARRPMRDADDRPSRRPVEDRQSAPKEEAPKRRARNFVGDDDDFEFEFLDLDD